MSKFPSRKNLSNRLNNISSSSGNSVVSIRRYLNFILRTRKGGKKLSNILILLALCILPTLMSTDTVSINGQIIHTTPFRVSPDCPFKLQYNAIATVVECKKLLCPLVLDILEINVHAGEELSPAGPTPHAHAMLSNINIDSRVHCLRVVFMC